MSSTIVIGENGYVDKAMDNNIVVYGAPRKVVRTFTKQREILT